MTLDDLRSLATGNRDGHPCWEGDFGAMAVTLPEAEFLYALCRIMRPTRVLETGTGRGISSRFLGEALLANGFGVLWTVEHDPAFRRSSADLLKGIPAVRRATSAAGLETEVDLVFLDSAPRWRRAEIRSWLSRESGPLVVIHDAARRYEELELGVGAFIPSQAGFWIGRAA